MSAKSAAIAMGGRRSPAPRGVSPLACRTEGRAGHVESYFFRANDPRAPRALWVKATILAPLASPPVAEAWFIWFDATSADGRTLAKRETVPFSSAHFGQDGIVVGPLELELGAPIGVRGAIDHQGRRLRLALRAERAVGQASRPLSLYPLSGLESGPFPRSKLLTPEPYLIVSGEIEVDGATHALRDWTGMLGHNWGQEHAAEYAWGQCLFPAERGQPSAMVEGFTGKVKVLGRSTPWISALVVRRGEEELRFDRLIDLWRQQAELSADAWRLALVGPGGEARLEMSARERPLVCLGYQNPDGHLSYCFNTKLAEVRLAVQPRRGPAFELYSSHGGALEFLRPAPIAGLEVL